MKKANDSMPPAPGICPSGGLLEQFLSSKLSEAEIEVVALHLDKCETCQQRVESDPTRARWTTNLRQASEQQTQTPVDVSMPLNRLNAILTDYKIVSEAGRGGGGVVYRARQLKLNRIVALKVLPALLGIVRPDAMARFRREAELAARLKHTNIITVYDFGEVDGTLFYTMEFVEGRSLREMLYEMNDTGTFDAALGDERTAAANTPVDEQDDDPDQKHAPTKSRSPIGIIRHSNRAYYRCVAEWIAEVAVALHYAHEQGVIHRDIKPSNLLLTTDGRLMIADFGLAHLPSAETLTTTPSLLGTCRYMSPEQIENHRGPIDGRVDIYGLGATLYELLTFQPMFAAADDREILSQVLNQEPTPPQQLVKQVPRELATICLKSVEKNRHNRYATAQDLADDLRRWLLDLPIHAQRPSLSARVVRLVRRRKVPVALGAIVSVLLITMSFMYAGYQAWHHRASDSEHRAWSTRVQEACIEAQLMFADGNHQPALTKINAVLAANPNEIELQLTMAELLHRLGRTDEANEYLSGIIEQLADSWAGHLMLARFYRERDDTQQEAVHHEELARQSMPPANARTYYVQALCEQDTSRAVELLNRSLELDPTDVGALLTRCLRLRDLRQFEARLADAKQAVALRPRWAVPYGQMGQALIELRRADEALFSLSRAIKLDPQNAIWWASRAKARTSLWHFPEALADVEEAIRINPGFASAYALRGFILASTSQDKNQFMEDFQHAIHLAPDDSAAYGARAIIMTRLGKWNEALADFASAEEANPGHVCICDNCRACIHRYQGRCYRELGEYGHAIQEFTRSIDLPSPEWIDCHGERGIAYFHLLQFEKAIADFTYVLDEQPTNKEYVLRRAVSFELLGNPQLALQDYDRVVATGGPITDWVLLWKYLLLRHAGSQDAASQLLNSRKRGKDIRVDQCFDIFTGAVSLDVARQAALSDTEQSQVFYYAGRKALLDGRLGDAHEAFSQCIGLGQPTLHSEVAYALLKQLEKNEASNVQEINHDANP